MWCMWCRCGGAGDGTVVYTTVVFVVDAVVHAVAVCLVVYGGACGGVMRWCNTVVVHVLVHAVVVMRWW